jgi:hypothetical protein
MSSRDFTPEQLDAIRDYLSAFRKWQQAQEEVRKWTEVSSRRAIESDKAHHRMVGISGVVGIHQAAEVVSNFPSQGN